MRRKPFVLSLVEAGTVFYAFTNVVSHLNPDQPFDLLTATAHTLLSHREVANVENAGAIFYLAPASIQVEGERNLDG